MEKTRRNYRTQTYIDGNTVRKLEAAPDYRREQEEKQREEIRQRNRRMAQKNQEKSAHMDLGYVAFLSVSLLVMCVAAVLYIRLQSAPRFQSVPCPPGGYTKAAFHYDPHKTAH